MNGNTLRIRIRASRLPGRECGPHREVRVGLQIGKDYTELIAGDATSATWEAEARLSSGSSAAVALRGPAIHGRGDERFLYLGWIERASNGKDEMFRRAKLQLDAVPDALVAKALRTGQALVAELELTDSGGMPLCASVRPPLISWTVE